MDKDARRRAGAGWQQIRSPARDWGLLRASSAVLLTGFALTVTFWVGLTLLLRHQWPWYVSPDQGTDRASEIDITNIALSVVAGVGAAVALTVTYRRQRDLERGRFDERFAAAAAQLGGSALPNGSPACTNTVAALADESTARRQQCIGLLCAYLRLPYDPDAGLVRTVVTEITRPFAAVTVREQRTYERLPNDRDVRLSLSKRSMRISFQWLSPVGSVTP